MEGDAKLPTIKVCSSKEGCLTRNAQIPVLPGSGSKTFKKPDEEIRRHAVPVMNHAHGEFQATLVVDFLECYGGVRLEPSMLLSSQPLVHVLL